MCTAGLVWSEGVYVCVRAWPLLVVNGSLPLSAVQRRAEEEGTEAGRKAAGCEC